MGFKLKLTAKELRQIGYPDGPLISLTMRLMEQHHKYTPHDEALTMLRQLWDHPDTYLTNPALEKAAKAIVLRNTPVAERKAIEKASATTGKTPLRDSPTPYAVYGSAGIEQAAIGQMDMAMRLPVSVAGTLMPDAHAGYGLPIGGVLATDNSVIPYAVGVDIGCRMCLTIYDLPESTITGQTDRLKNMLLRDTQFGLGGEWANPMDDAVLDRPEFGQLSLLRGLRAKAARQLGTSGSGNHFVEFGVVTITAADALDVLPGTYLGLLSHSGSRGLGAAVANHFTKIAMQQTGLPREAKHLAWLDLDTDAGQQYWLAMTLAGDYAATCHHQIHRRLAKSLGEKPLVRIENHHNFAWKEMHDGRQRIVHRKGATPAGAGTLGIIPGSMVQSGFIVRGRGVPASLQSASHGAGRQLSRAEAKSTITQSKLNRILDENGVTLLGGGIDEAPMAYKDLTAVMQSQRELVDVLGTFQPRIVRMDEG